MNSLYTYIAAHNINSLTRFIIDNIHITRTTMSLEVSIVDFIRLRQYYDHNITVQRFLDQLQLMFPDSNWNVDRREYDLSAPILFYTT